MDRSAEKSRNQSIKTGQSGVVDVVLRAIEEDPFYTISELRVVIEESLSFVKSSWWSVFNILRKKKLLSRRSRFRYARQRRRRL